MKMRSSPQERYSLHWPSVQAYKYGLTFENIDRKIAAKLQRDDRARGTCDQIDGCTLEI
jgi:hypothetical protein